MKLAQTGIILGALLLMSAMLASPAFAEQNTSYAKSSPTAKEMKHKVYMMVQGKIMEDKAATLMLEAQKAYSKSNNENAKSFTLDQRSELQKSFLKQAETKRLNDEMHRKIIQDKIALHTKMTALKIQKLVDQGKLGKPLKDHLTIELGRTK